MKPCFPKLSAAFLIISSESPTTSLQKPQQHQFSILLYYVEPNKNEDHTD